jgi:hypothetical protein
MEAHRVLLAIGWLILLIYSFILAPVPYEDGMALVEMAKGNIMDKDPLLVSVFNLMGVIPMMMAVLLLPIGRVRKLPSWPFVVLSFMSGAFALLPYFIFGPGKRKDSKKGGRFFKVLGGRIVSVSILTMIILLLIFGLIMGNPSDYWRLFLNDRSVHIMTFDFIILLLLLPMAVVFNMKYCHDDTVKIPILLIWIPFIGPSVYLVYRSFKMND